MKTTHNKLIGLLATAIIGLTLSSCGGGGGSDKNDSGSSATQESTSTSTSSSTSSDSSKIGPTNLTGKVMTINHTIQNVKQVTFTSSSALKVTGTTTTGTYTFKRGSDARSATLSIFIPSKGITRLDIEMEFQNSTTAKASSFKGTINGTNSLNLGGGTVYFN